MLSTIRLEKSYHDLVDMMVCDKDSKICMIHQCDKCLGSKPVEVFLHKHLDHGHLQAHSVDTDKDGISCDNEEIDIEFKQWITTDGTDLVYMNLPIDDFIENLCRKFKKITGHSFIAESQSSYIKQLKETIGQNEAIVICE